MRIWYSYVFLALTVVLSIRFFVDHGFWIPFLFLLFVNALCLIRERALLRKLRANQEKDRQLEYAKLAITQVGLTVVLFIVIVIVI
ncbi:hypothetical protein ACTHQ4_16920 [Alkalicoccobacillus gibsonii]|uniref:hypothetical protein n=1 Tax=Alkalicoccobacillus gibsonii TaxID=79881 RepID=UPI003F7C1562